MMNFFKRGYDIHAPLKEKSDEVHQYIFAGEEFILPLVEKEASIYEKHEHISLVTLYPRHYKDVYSRKEQYFKAISSIETTEHSYDETTGTTSIHVQ